MTRFSLAFEGDKDMRVYPELVKKMEKYDYYSVQIYEHIPFKPSWPIVFHSAIQTRKMKIGPVTIPVFQSDPLTLARCVAALDEIAPGRATIGISRGGYARHMPTEVQPNQRAMGRVIETVEFIDSWLSLMGRSNSTRTPPQEYQENKVEILVGTSGPKLCARACKSKAVRGVIVDALWNPDYAKRLRQIMNEELRAAGRKSGDVRLIARPFTMVAKTSTKARQIILPILRSYVRELVGDSPMLKSVGLSHQELVADDKRLDEKIDNFAALGSEDEIADQVNRMLKAGIDDVCFGLPLSSDVKEAIEYLGRNLLPHFEGR